MTLFDECNPPLLISFIFKHSRCILLQGPRQVEGCEVEQHLLLLSFDVHANELLRLLSMD